MSDADIAERISFEALSCSVLSKRVLQIDQRRCLGSLESCSVRAQRTMQGRRRRSVASLEGSSDLTKEQCKIGELRRFLGAFASSLAHTIGICIESRARVLEALGAAHYTRRNRCREYKGGIFGATSG